jgi:hypothetical protein
MNRFDFDVIGDTPAPKPRPPEPAPALPQAAEEAAPEQPVERRRNNAA